MSSRRYPTAELYEERQKEFYRNGNRSERSYDELDIELRRGDPRRSAPDILRESFDRQSNAGQMVVHERRTEDFTRGPPSRRELDEDQIVIRSGRAPPPPASSVREVEREQISIHRGDHDRRRPREVEREETDITIRHRDQSRPRGPELREVEREDIVFRRGDGAPPARSRPREVEIEREDIRFTPRRREADREEVVFRHEHREDSRHGREHDVHKDSLVIRGGRERSLPPPRRGDLIAREHEEIVMRRREPSPPHREREVVKDEIIIRRKEQRTPTPPPAPLPPPPPPVEPEIRPPIIQEIITHHRHIDHGVERARSPTPPPLPPSPPRNESLEISIRRNESRNPGRDFEEDIIYERETIERKGRDDFAPSRRGRSLSAPRRARTMPVDDLEQEAEYYNRKALDRAYPGEAWNGATKDWAIVDVPPGTSRVRMDGIGGGGQEITWQRYNGVRRSKFISGDEEIATDFGAPAPVKPRTKDMWTEITKDLVLREAIDSMGYACEETDDFFYVMEYLKYEDVLQLVELSDEIRRRRKARIRQIEYEREEIRERRPPPSWDERYYEHEVSVDRHRSRYR